VTELVVSAPASSANLGAGFDAVGLGIEIRMSARVRALPRGSTAHWTYAGPHAPTHDGIRACVEAGLGRVAPGAPPLEVELTNAIPLGAGLGSSAAAYAIGVALGGRFADPSPDDAALALAVAELEGHPDNALAAWYGGAIVAALGEDGLTSVRFPAPKVDAVVVVPELTLPTSQARALLPRAYIRRRLGRRPARPLTGRRARPIAPTVPSERDPGPQRDPGVRRSGAGRARALRRRAVRPGAGAR
jgi:homoserine kinase